FNELVHMAKIVVNIDHHISNPLYGDINIVDGHMSSTCELLYTLIDDKTLCDSAIATCLYTGIIYDTGIFKHSNTTSHTLNVAGELIDYGIDFSEIINTVFFYKSYKGLLVQKIAIERMEIIEDNQVVISYITIEDMKSLKAYKKHTESIIQMLNEIKGTRCAVFIYEIKSEVFKVSLRAKDTINVCAVAKAFGGGGHIKAAGCTIEADIEAVKMKLIYEIKKQL
ncbi:MAG: DHHA1 domain-containing protein, partial [Vallitaleaceae bacterium]|nr:DHHA1 domain-containing protein [Vallitaleaceae bacterium]